MADTAKTTAPAPPKNDGGGSGGNKTQTIGTGEGQVSPAAADRDPSVLEGVKVDTSEAERVASGDKVPLYNVHAGVTRRVGGPFLDELELEQAEVRRAVIEGREPDFKNNAGSAGVPLVTAAELAVAHSADHRALGQFIEDNADNSKKGPTPVAHVDAARNPTKEILETQAAERKAYADYDETKVTSHDDPDVVFTPAAFSTNKSKA